MTNLTEQWKKCELPCGWYYIKIVDIVFIDFFEGKVWKNKKDKYVDEVIAEVPDYVEWQNMVNCACEELLNAAQTMMTSDIIITGDRWRLLTQTAKKYGI